MNKIGSRGNNGPSDSGDYAGGNHVDLTHSSFWQPINPRMKKIERIREENEKQAALVQRLIEDAKVEYGPIISDSVDKMTADDAMGALQRLHGRLDINSRPVDPRYRVEYGIANIRNKEYISPEQGLKDELFGEYLNAIKSVDEKKKKAALAYYAINNLHLFSDGNGRTSRAAYLLIMQKDVPNPEEYMMHGFTCPDESGRYREYDGSRRLYVDEQVILADEMNKLVNILIQKELTDSGRLERTLSDVATSDISFYVESSIPSLSSQYFNSLSSEQKFENGYVDIWISEENRRALNDAEQKDLLYALSDTGLGRDYSSLSGLALAVVLNDKGTLQKNIEINLEEDNRLTFITNYSKVSDDPRKYEYERRVRALLSDWDVSDYRALIQVYRWLKRRQNEITMLIFADNLCFPSGQSIADWAIGEHYAHDKVGPTGQDNSLLAKFMRVH